MLPVRFHSRPSAAKQAGPRLTKRLIFRDGVNKDNYDTLITALIPAGAAVPVNGPGRRGSTQVVSRDPREPALTPSCPHLGETVILSARRKRKRGEKKRKSAQRAAAKSVYSCTASNIHQMPSLQCVMWGNQHFTGCQMMSKALAGWQCQKGNGSNTHTQGIQVFFLVRLLTDEVPRMLKY